MQRVYPYISGLQLINRFIGTQKIARPDRRTKPKLGRVGFFQRFIKALERVYRQGGPEDLFGGHARVLRHVAHQRWRVVEALVKVPAFRPLAAEQSLSSARFGVFYLVFDFLPL